MATRIPIPTPGARQALPLGLPAASAPMITVDQAHRYAFTEHIRAAAQMAQDEHDQAKQREEQHKREQDNAWLAKQSSDDQIKWTERSMELQRTAEPGAPNYTPKLLKEYDDYTAQALQAAPPGARPAYQERLTRLRTSLGTQAVSFEANQNRAHTVSQYTEAFNNDARSIALNPSYYDEARIFGNAALDASSLPADVKASLRTQANAVWANAAANAHTLNNPRAVLKAMQVAAQGKPLPQGYGWIGHLDASGIERTRSRAQTEVDRRDNQAKIAAAQRNNAASGALNAYVRQLALGIPARAEDMSRWASAIKGTPHEAEFKRLQKGYAQVQSLFAKPVAEQVEGLQAMQAKLQSEGGNAQDLAMAQRAEKALIANIQMQTQAPLQWLAQFADVPIEPLDLTVLATQQGADNVAAILTQRDYAINALQQQNPGVPIAQALLLPEEAQAITQAFGAGNARESGQLLASLVQAIGSENIERQDAIFAQLETSGAGDAQDLVRIASLAADSSQAVIKTHWFSPDEIQTSEQSAYTALHGRDILRANGKLKDGPHYKLPRDTDLMAEIQNEIGEAYGSPVPGDSGYESLLHDAQVIKYWYVGEAARSGKLGEDINSDLLDQAIRATVGKKVDFNSNGNVIMPRGMEEDRFNKHANFAIEETLKANQLWDDESDATDYGLATLGGGRYMVTLGDTPIGVTIQLDTNDTARDALIDQLREARHETRRKAIIEAQQAHIPLHSFDDLEGEP